MTKLPEQTPGFARKPEQSIMEGGAPTKGHCRWCGKYVGRGVMTHERWCWENPSDDNPRRSPLPD